MSLIIDIYRDCPLATNNYSMYSFDLNLLFYPLLIYVLIIEGFSYFNLVFVHAIVHII